MSHATAAGHARLQTRPPLILVIKILHSVIMRARMPKLVIAGASDPQMSHADAALTARRIGAPPPVYVPAGT